MTVHYQIFSSTAMGLSMAIITNRYTQISQLYPHSLHALQFRDYSIAMYTICCYVLNNCPLKLFQLKLQLQLFTATREARD